MANEYVTAAVLKAELNIGDSDDDTRIDRVRENVSRLIDDYCGFPTRQFYAGSPGEVRYYTADGDPTFLWVDDFSAVTAVELDASGDGTFETSLDVTAGTGDVHRYPYNAAGLNRPYIALELSSNATTSFPSARRGVKVTGTFGFPAIPEVVEEAALIQSARIFQRARQSPYGIAQVPTLEAGSARLMARLDPDVEVMLKPLVRKRVGVV